MPLFPIRPLAVALISLGLGAASALAQAPVPAEQAAPVARLAPEARLTAGGALLGPDTPLLWELFSLDAAGKPFERVASSGAGTELAVPPGDYLLVANLDMAFAAQKVTLAEGANPVPQFVLNAGLLDLTPQVTLGGEVLNGAALYLTAADGSTMSYLGPTRAFVPAGKVTLTAVFDAVRIQDAVQVGAGETVARTLVAEAGAADVRLGTGGLALPEGTEQRLDIFAAPATAGGTPRLMVFDMLPERRFILPPGEYIAQGLVQGASLKQPFSLRAGEVVPVAIDLAVGQLQVAAPGANSLAVMRATDNPAEPWRMLFHQWDLTALDYIVPAGDYLIEAIFETGKVEKPVTVAAGAVVPVTVP